MASAPRILGLILVAAAALLQTVTSRNFNETIYVVTASSQVVGGSRESLCVQVLDPTELLAVRVELQLEQHPRTTLLEEWGVVQDYYRCLPYQVPVVTTETVATLHVTVEGEVDTMSNKAKILVQPSTFINLIQTDKPIYKPGQKVQFRIVSLDSSFVPYNQMYQTVELEDPNSNRIAQWLNQSTVSGILDLAHPTTPEAAEGHYTITTWNQEGQRNEHMFEIKEYVLPKYEVKVHLPKVISILDTHATLRVCGKYTYGKPVLGSVKASVCRNSWYGSRDEPNICRKYEIRTDQTGCATQVVDVTEFALTKTSFEDRFMVKTELEEYGTGVVLKGSGSAKFTTAIRSVTFEDVPDAYKPGIAYQGKIKLTGPDSSPIANEPVQLTVSLGPGGNVSESWNLTTDSTGMVLFSLDTTLWTSTMFLQAKPGLAKDEEFEPDVRRPDYHSAYHHPAAFYSKSRSFLKLQPASQSFPCDTDATVDANYVIQGEELKEGQSALDFFYMVMSRGSVVQHGRLSVAVKEGEVNRGQLHVPLQSMVNLAPFAQVVVYTVMPGGEAVADSKDFPVQLCLKNKVSLRFSSPQELPGAESSLSLQAEPGSLCSLRAIDQSVLLLRPERELSLEAVFEELPVHRLLGYSYVEDEEPYPCIEPYPEPEPEPTSGLEPSPEPEPPSRRKRSYIPINDEKDDVYNIFKAVGIKILTNSDVKKPINCNGLMEEIFYEDSDRNVIMRERVPVAVAMSVEDSEAVKETVRTYFPETWIWDLVPVGESGSVSLEKIVPDTITKWAAGAFCTSSVGLGLAPTVGLTAFQPFFVSLTLPYSVIRGEVFTLRATVFNYLSKCIMVKATLAESDQFGARPCDDCQYQVCLCADESRTFQWIITPTTLGEVSVKVSAEALQTEVLCGNEVATVPETGRIDTVVRSLLVEAEGTQETVRHNVLLNPAEGPVERSVSLQLPAVFVEGSVKASVSVLGDLMGRAMQNLDSLLAMPYGCGEQNMVLFAPNIYILAYLQSTGQLTDNIRSKATHFLESGYQRELNYKHEDGSYSAFGKSDESGNTWLTSFVMKSFGGARSYIYVDPAHISKAKSWLADHQRPDGCFASVGKLFNNGMKGGVSDDVSLTAYILVSLLELGDNTTDPVVARGLGCLKTVLAGDLDHLYTSALLSYAFTLAGDQEARSQLLSHLHRQANTADAGLHWERAEHSEKHLDSIAVEMTSYVLLAVLSGPSLDGFGLDYASSIVRWLAQQQNPYGGFSSTQDTVVALQALAKYGAATYSPEGASAVVVSSAGGLKHEFSVDQHNRLLYQELPLGEVPAEYMIRAEGQSSVFLQMVLRYNIPPPPDSSSFHVTTAVLGQCNSTKPVLTVNVAVRYNGPREETNMIVINFKLLSGFIVDKNSLKPRDGNVKRVDQEEGRVIIYLERLRQEQSQSYTLDILQDIPVENLKPAVVKVYDYYQTSDEAVTEYSSPCADSAEDGRRTVEHYESYAHQRTSHTSRLDHHHQLSSPSSYFVDGDPHFIIELPEQGDALCFNINDPPGTIFNLVKDPQSGVLVNGQTIGATWMAPGEKMNTYFGRFGIVLPWLRLRVEVSTQEITVSQDGKHAKLPWSSTSSVKGPGMELHVTRNHNMTITLKDSVKFVVLLHRVHHQEYLGFYTLDSHLFSPQVHGLLGQFYHGVQFEVKDLRPGQTPEKPDATMLVKGKQLTVTRGWQWDYRRNMDNGEKVPCWFIHNNGAGLIDRHLSDYILSGLFQTA